MNPEKQAMAVVFRHKAFFALQALAVALWAALAMSWYWLPDSKTWGVATAALLAGVVIVGAVWLIASTFVFYRRAHAGDDVRLAAVYREGLRRSPVLLPWAAILVLELWMTLRPSVPRWFWIVVPMFLLPPAARMAAEGLRGLFRNAWRVRYFAQFAVLASVGVFLPYVLVGWHPSLPGVALQTASLAMRFLAAYLLAMASWSIMASLLAEVPAQSPSGARS
jgi:hypothetical protein